MSFDPLQKAREIVAEQAEDEGLWFQPKYITEDYFQLQLRRLHAAIEGDEAALIIVEKNLKHTPTEGAYT